MCVTSVKLKCVNLTYNYQCTITVIRIHCISGLYGTGTFSNQSSINHHSLVESKYMCCTHTRVRCVFWWMKAAVAFNNLTPLAIRQTVLDCAPDTDWPYLTLLQRTEKKQIRQTDEKSTKCYKWTTGSNRQPTSVLLAQIYILLIDLNLHRLDWASCTFWLRLVLRLWSPN